MKSTVWARPIATGIALAATAATLAATPAQAATAGLTFATKVTVVHGSLPLFALRHSAAPTSLVAGFVGRTALGLENTRLVSRDGQGVVHAYVDGISGDAEIFPDLTATTGPDTGELAVRNAARSLFARTDLIPKDATQTQMGDVKPIFSAQVARSADGKTHQVSAPQKLFTYVSAQRYAAGLPVVGDGSRATVAIGNDGSVRGLVRRWQTASPAGSVASLLTPAQLEAAIAAQLRPLENAHTAITVDSVRPAYYDGNAKFVQPVYEFYATLHPVSGRAANDHVRGYIPVGKLVEALPVIGQKLGSSPSAPVAASTTRKHVMGSVSQITLGEYANRDGTMQDMANAYNNGFHAWPGGWFGPPINRTQWYWAYPYQVEQYANYYLNAVNVAYTMPHGDWWENTTYSNYADFWYIYDIGVNGNPGYGAAAGGQLATWIIDSCEVIPSYYDLQFTTGNGWNAFNYWWPVFKGLHRALGFRTQMLLGEDTMNYDIAYDMEIGANANSAFYNTVASFSFPTYQDAHLNNTWVHYDRASMMFDPRNSGESIYSVQGQSASGQLSNTWMGN